MLEYSQGRNNHGKAFVFISYRRYHFKNDSGQHANNIPSYLLSNNHIMVFYWQQLFLGVFIS